MKKLMTLMLGFGLILGTTSFAFANGGQDTTKTTKTKKMKKSKKVKTTDSTEKKS